MKEKIIQKLRSMMERADLTWERPFIPNQPVNTSGRPYRGINYLILTSTALAMGYSSPYWFTYRGAQRVGAQVRKGEKGTLIIFAKVIEDEETGEKRFIQRFYTVFNGDQVDGLPERYLTPNKPAPVDMLDLIDRIGATVVPGDRAAYIPGKDVVSMPPVGNFKSEAHYISTLCHELIHWTGAKHRLDRIVPGAPFGSAAYAEEELVAEFGGAALMAAMGHEPLHEHSAAYLQSWQRALQGDPKAVVRAMSAAGRAVDYVLDLAGIERHGAEPILEDEENEEQQAA